MNRVDVLPGKRSAFALLGRAVLSPAADPALQALAELTASQLSVPMALVSLVLEHVELFKAQHGLPEELGVAGAIGRDEAFCQYAVRAHDVVQIEDAALDAGVPHALVERFGIRSFLGAPVDVEGEAVGTLCVMDFEPRRFTNAECDLIRNNSLEASRRMTDLVHADAPPPGALRDRAMRPQFAELRNRLQPIVFRARTMQIALAEIEAVHRMAAYVAVHPDRPVEIIRLDAAADAVSDLANALDGLQASVTQIERAVGALESATLLAVEPSSVHEIIDAATTLAHHDTKLVGGVRLPIALPSGTVLAPRAAAVNALAAVLSSVSREALRAGVTGGLGVGVADESVTTRVRVSVDKLADDVLRTIVGRLGPLLRDAPFVDVVHDDVAIEVVFTRV